MLYSSGKSPLPPSSCPRTNRTSIVVPKTPARSRRHTLATAALINSARKAMNQASRITDEKRRKSLSHEETSNKSQDAKDPPEKPRTPLAQHNPPDKDKVGVLHLTVFTNKQEEKNKKINKKERELNKENTKLTKKKKATTRQIR